MQQHFFQMIRILRMEEPVATLVFQMVMILRIANRTVHWVNYFAKGGKPVAKRTVRYDKYFANDLNIATRQVECNNFSSSNDLYPEDGWTCCKKDGPIGQLFCT